MRATTLQSVAACGGAEVRFKCHCVLVHGTVQDRCTPRRRVYLSCGEVVHGKSAVSGAWASAGLVHSQVQCSVSGAGQVHSKDDQRSHGKTRPDNPSSATITVL